jgi:hypothetical protein
MSSYSRDFFLVYNQGSYQSAKAILPIVFDLVSPQSVVDIGCGVAPWLAAARDLGATDTLGIDGEYVDRNLLMVPQECFLAADLSLPITVSRKFQLAICMEVAEHLPASSSTMFIKSLCALSPVVLFSAAIPGQGGTGHLNEQWPPYWEKLFNDCGFELLDCVRWRVWNHQDVEFWYAQNSVLFVEREYLARNPALAEEQAKAQVLPRCMVHPALFTGALKRSLSRRLLNGAKRRMAKYFGRRDSGKVGQAVRTPNGRP